MTQYQRRRIQEDIDRQQAMADGIVPTNWVRFAAMVIVVITSTVALWYFG